MVSGTFWYWLVRSSQQVWFGIETSFFNSPFGLSCTTKRLESIIPLYARYAISLHKFPLWCLEAARLWSSKNLFHSNTTGIHFDCYLFYSLLFPFWSLLSNYYLSYYLFKCAFSFPTQDWPGLIKEIMSLEKGTRPTHFIVEIEIYISTSL